MKQKTWGEIAFKRMRKKTPKFSKTRLTAHWIDVSDATTDNGGYDWHIRDIRCDNCCCALRTYHEPPYCSGCGARMVKNDKLSNS